MKKIFTLVILIVSIQTLFAQRDTTRRNRRDTTNWQGRRMAGDTSFRRSDNSFGRSGDSTQSRQRRNVTRDSSSSRNITTAPATQTRIVTGNNDTTHGSVQGRLMDTINKQIISQASLSLINTRDSSVAARSLSGADGSFNIGEVPFGNYSLRIGFQGYDNITRAFTVRADSPLVNLGNIYMYLQANQLLDVVVTASPRPIIIRKDTVEFNAANITVKPNGNVEDLLNKIPGVETDKDGNVKAQGEQVQRILVDGKRFFGDDPKMATRNLPPDVVDKIQVFDAQSDQSAFSGFDDGERVK
ncbi:MAG: hypothetical protein JWN76_596, partial [Chitinophagaceae bacterium]|nr:hypothetical protein [Chitinophagaceae bacterium]